MAASNPLVGRIVALLGSEAHERQIAAAIVLGRSARALSARDEQVRASAVEAAVALGQPATDAVRARLRDTVDPLERRGLEAALGRTGGRGAFGALLAALDTPDVESRAAALAVRQRVKDTAPRERGAMLAQVTELLRGRAAATRKPGAPLGLVTGGLKILGFLEDPGALPTLLAFARDAREPERIALLARLLRPRARALAGSGAAGKKLARAIVLTAVARLTDQLAPEQRYQIGFALIERRQAAGEEILAQLAGEGRGKVAKMAKAKLRSAGSPI